MRRRLIDKEIRPAFKYLGNVSLNLALHIIGGFFLGRYLDLRWSTAPILAMLGTILGTFTGFYGIYRVVMNDVAGKPDSMVRNQSRRDHGRGDQARDSRARSDQGGCDCSSPDRDSSDCGGSD